MNLSRCAFVLPFLLGAALHAQGGELLTAEQARGITFSGAPPVVRWAADGVHLVLGSGAAARLLDPSTGTEEAAPPEEQRAVLPPVPDRGRRPGSARRPPRIPAPGAKLTAASPDGKQVSFVRDGDLWVWDDEAEKERRLTEDGGTDRLNGELDWVYQEEVYGRGTYRAHWWSPDSQRIAFLSLWVKDVPYFAIANPVPRRIAQPIQFQPAVTMQRYPKPGQPNPVARLGVRALADSETVWVDLSGFPEDCLVVRVDWTPDGQRVLFMVQNRIQTWLELCDADPATGAVRKLIHEESPGWTNRRPPPRWLADGSFLWESERSGFNHLYHYRGDGTLIRPITSGEWAVTGIDHVDEKSSQIWFTANRDGAVDSHWYRIGFDGSGLTRLTKERGQHRLSFNRDRSYAIDTWSSLTLPPRVSLVDAKGNVVRELGEAAIPARKRYLTGTRELLEIPARDGYAIDAALLMPPAGLLRDKHPIWLPTYSGPNAPSVRNAWDGSGWDQFLVQQGFLVLEVNVRSASRKGQKYAAACYRQLGVSELQDLEDAVKWVCENRRGDAARVGIAGWSYGGFMAAFALTHSKAFALGIAGAGVYDWRLYDTIYTERYMSTPQDNADGYDRTSCILAAKDLRGHLVLLHGTEDDNVHFQNCMQFVYALQLAGKDFELMIFPNSMHGVGGAQGQQQQRMTWRAMQQYLLGA